MTTWYYTQPPYREYLGVEFAISPHMLADAPTIDLLKHTMVSAMADGGA